MENIEEAVDQENNIPEPADQENHKPELADQGNNTPEPVEQENNSQRPLEQDALQDIDGALVEVKARLEDLKSRMEGLNVRSDRDVEEVRKLVESINDEFKIVIRKFFYEAEQFNDQELARIRQSLSEGIEERREAFIDGLAEVNNRLSEQFATELDAVRGLYEEKLTRYITDIEEANDALATGVRDSNEAFAAEMKESNETFAAAVRESGEVFMAGVENSCHSLMDKIQKQLESYLSEYKLSNELLDEKLRVHIESFYEESRRLFEGNVNNLRTLFSDNLDAIERRSNRVEQSLEKNNTVFANYAGEVQKLQKVLEQRHSFLENGFQKTFQSYIETLNKKQAEHYESFGSFLTEKYSANVDELTRQLAEYQDRYKKALQAFVDEMQEEYQSNLEDELRTAMDSMNEVVENMQKKNRTDQRSRQVLLAAMIFICVMTALNMIFSNGMLSIAPIIFSLLIAVVFYLIMYWRA